TRESAKLQDWLAFLKARLANLRDDWEEARAIFERLLRNRLLPTELGAYVLDGLGRVYYRLGEIGKAESVYSQALEAYKEAGRERGEAEVLYQLAKIDIAQRKWSAAKSKLEECVARFDKVSEDASKESWSEPLRGAVPAVERARASVLSSLGWIYLIQGYWDQALDKYSEALEMFQKLQDDYGAGCSLYQVGWALQQKGKWDEAVECYRQSREILADLGANYRVARTIVKLADVYRVQGRLEESEEVYLECMRICIRLKAELGIAVVLDSLGCLYQAQGLLRKAEIVHNKSFARKQDISFPFEIELTWMNLADLRVKQGEIDQALEYYGESLKLMQSMENKHGEALILLKMCEAAAMSQREISRATDWMKRAETLAEKYQYPEIQCRIHRLRGDRFVSEGDYESAIREYQRALQRAQDFNEYIYQDIHQSLLARSAEWPDVPQAIKLRELLDESL
nr:tetratricopeptide repeat protein [Chloroflexota bacterium]